MKLRILKRGDYYYPQVEKRYPYIAPRWAGFESIRFDKESYAREFIALVRLNIPFKRRRCSEKIICQDKEDYSL